MEREGQRGFVTETLDKSKLLDWGGVAFGVLIGSVGLVLLSAGLLIGKNEVIKSLENKKK